MNNGNASLIASILLIGRPLLQMNPKKIQIDKFSTKDVSGTPEDFDKKYEARRNKPKPRSPLEEPRRSNMDSLLEKYGLSKDRS